jgi:hypothetical protein
VAATAWPVPTGSPPAVSAAMLPSATASCGFKRSAPPKSSPFLLLPLTPHPYSPRHAPFPPWVPHGWLPSLATAHLRFHHHEVPTGTLNLNGPQADTGDPMSELPLSFLSALTPPKAPCCRVLPSPCEVNRLVRVMMIHSPKSVLIIRPECTLNFLNYATFPCFMTSLAFSLVCSFLSSLRSASSGFPCGPPWPRLNNKLIFPT